MNLPLEINNEAGTYYNTIKDEILRYIDKYPITNKPKPDKIFHYVYTYFEEFMSSYNIRICMDKTYVMRIDDNDQPVVIGLDMYKTSWRASDELHRMYDDLTDDEKLLLILL